MVGTDHIASRLTKVSECKLLILFPPTVQKHQMMGLPGLFTVYELYLLTISESLNQWKYIYVYNRN